LNETMASTFPHLARSSELHASSEPGVYEFETQQKLGTLLLPESLEKWDRVHWTIAYSNFLNFYGYNDSDESRTLRRYKEWIKKGKKVYEHNKHSVYQSSSPQLYQFELEMNQFSDLSKEELVDQGLFIDMPKIKSQLPAVLEPIQHSWLEWGSSTPDELDWRKQGCVQEVKNQERCGSCWAFSTVEAIESAVCATKLHKYHGVGAPGPVSPVAPSGEKHKPSYNRSLYLPNLSEQQLVDCAAVTGNHGCNGGLMEMGFEYVRRLESGELCSEEDYPYTAKEGKCMASTCSRSRSSKDESNDWRVSGWQRVPRFSKEALKAALYKHGAISVSIEADRDVFHLYKRGIVHDKGPGETCGQMLDHGVNAVGYGVDDDSGDGYWIVKNSWGPTWGEEGFVRLSMSDGGRSGECGILMDASFPVIEID